MKTLERNSRLQTAIKKAGFSQREIARKVDMNEVVLSKIISGRLNPLQREKVLIVTALNKPISDLFD